MHPKVFAPQKASYYWWSRLAAGAVVLFPLSLHQIDFRATFNQGLSVSAHRSSPAYAAFEDLRENYASDFPEIPDNGTVLAAGQPFTWVQAAGDSQHHPGLRQIALKGMTIRAPAAVEAAPVNVAQRQVPPQIPGLVQAAQPLSLRDDYGQLLPLNERKRLLLNQLRDEDWSVPTPQALARELVAQELNNGSVVEKTIRAHSGAPIYIRSQAPPLAAAPPAMAPAPPGQALANNVNTFSSSTTTLAARPLEPANLRPLWLAGQIEMTGGLAFVGPQSQMVIKRVFNGRTFEQGRIWVTEGKFEIRVGEATGYLVAELHSEGRVLGRGEISLLELTSIPEKDDHINDLRIALRPTAEGATFRAISGYSHDNQKMPVTSARIEIQAYADAQKVNDEGSVSEPTLSRDSSFVARALAASHWSSLVVGQAQEPQDIRLFANSLMDALINLNLSGSDKKEAYTLGVVWGRLTQNGQPLVGGQVEMAGNYQPVYLNDSYLPDPNLKGTAKNGMFAILKVKPGVQALRVRVAEKVYPAQVFPTEAKHVSYVELEVRDKVVSQVRVFDGINLNKPVNASIRLVGSEDTLNVGRDNFVEYSVAANPFMVEADGGLEYEPSRVTITGSPHVINVPLVQREWLYTIAAQKHVDQDPARGIIVGYMDQHDFEVELTGYASNESMQIIYFDSHGTVWDGKTGVAGGGFVIFNAPMGLQTLYIHPTQSRETFGQIVVAEPQFVQVVTH